MLKAIQAELYKLFKNRTFKVLICVAVLLSTLTVVMCSSVFEKILNDSLGNMPQDLPQSGFLAVQMVRPSVMIWIFQRIQ